MKVEKVLDSWFFDGLIHESDLKAMAGSTGEK